MKLIDSTQIHPDPSTWRGKLCKWFIDNVNFCSDYYDGSEKPENKIYNFFRDYWLFPFEQTGCACCNTVRGLIYGAIIGFVVGRLI